jgi:Tol biopolymer transport system component
MKKAFFSLVMVVILTLVACAAPTAENINQPTADQVATIVAMTLQALAAEEADTPTNVPEALASQLPHSLYFIANDNQSISQLYRLERDGKTKTQLTFELVNVTDYDVSLADGSIAYVASNQLLLANADGSNRRLLIDGGSGPDLRGFYAPVFSPDGQTLAYSQNGLYLYDMAAGVSKLVIEDQLSELRLPIETYSAVHYSPDGKKLLVALGHWEQAPAHGVYDLVANTLVKYAEVEDYMYCCSFHGGPVWAPDSSSFYGVASVHDTVYQSGELWRVDAGNGALTRLLKTSDGMMNLPKEVYLAPDGRLYYFLGSYSVDAGYFDAPMLELVRSAPDGVTDRTVLREENFVLMDEALWAPDASFVIVAIDSLRSWELQGGVLELYYTDGQKEAVWLAPFGHQMKWGP